MDTFTTGTLAGAGSFRCAGCGFHVAVRTADHMPECPHCGEANFVRTSMFDVDEPDTSDLPDEDVGWLEDVRDGIHDDGYWLAFCDAGRVSIFAVSQEWTRIGRSLTANLRLDDPTVSRRHALLCRQEGRVRVLDDRSLNGVFLNGDRVEWHDLEDNDELVIGRYRLHFIDTTGGGIHSGIGAAATLA